MGDTREVLIKEIVGAVMLLARTPMPIRLEVSSIVILPPAVSLPAITPGATMLPAAMTLEVPDSALRICYYHHDHLGSSSFVSDSVDLNILKAMASKDSREVAQFN